MPPSYLQCLCSERTASCLVLVNLGVCTVGDCVSQNLYWVIKHTWLHPAEGLHTERKGSSVNEKTSMFLQNDAVSAIQFGYKNAAG